MEVVSPRTSNADRFAKPGEYADAGIALFWRLEPEPSLVLHAFRLHGASYDAVAEVHGAAMVPVPWGRLPVDLRRLQPDR